MDYKFYKVERANGWGGYSDRWNDKLIVKGCYIVRWPDGSETQENVKVEVIPTTYGDMGHTYDSAQCSAYVEVIYKGVTARVYLPGLFIKPVHDEDCEE